MRKKDWEPQYTYTENKYYKLFREEREKIKSKYPPHLFDESVKKYGEGDRELFQQFLKEIADIIFEPNSNYQEFTWDIMGEQEKEIMKRKAEGPKWGGTGEYRI